MAGCAATRLRDLVLPSCVSYLSCDTLSIPSGCPDPSLDSLGVFLSKRSTQHRCRRLRTPECPRGVNGNRVNTAVWSAPDNCAMFAGMAADIGERLPEDPGRRRSDGDHFLETHDAVSTFNHLKDPESVFIVDSVYNMLSTHRQGRLSADNDIMAEMPSPPAPG